MAEINMPQKGGRRKVQAPRMDFTPMVDLGFILITFFIYTTTIAKPGSLEINMPDNEKINGPTLYTEESTVTLIPVKGHRVVYYFGTLNGPEQLKVQPAEYIREMLLRKKRQVADLPLSFSKQAHELHVILKPNDDCKYEDVVRMFDDINLVGVPYSAMVDITDEEKSLVHGL